MPNRIIKESICYSDDVDRLTPFEENVFIRLIVNCDDFGRIDARPCFLKSRLFATKKGVTEKTVEEAVSKLATVGLVRLYKVDGKSFLLFPKWDCHQQVRAKKSKYPAPDIVCNQMISDDIKCPRNPIQSESYSNTNAEKETIYSDVISYMNEKSGTNYREVSKKTRALIDARVSEGFTLSDFKRVIDNKCFNWNHEPTGGEKDMRGYLRPETLFGTKFEGYLNQKGVPSAPVEHEPLSPPDWLGKENPSIEEVLGVRF